jgi:hypothetical protein
VQTWPASVATPRRPGQVLIFIEDAVLSFFYIACVAILVLAILGVVGTQLPR